jgi:energy-coupling factor transport system ATP-binding protein
LRDISVDFRPGEVALLAGGSGSGKTTLIRCINGLIPLAYKEGTLQGAIRCFGESTAGLSLAQIAGRVATVMQDPEKQIVASRVRNDIAFGLENIGLPRAEIITRIESVAQQLRITHLLERATHTLSGGERQRVVIAGALAVDPRALLLDEPLASLDPPSAREALDLFASLARDGITVVLVEHRVRDVLRIRPMQCLLLADGALRFQGDTGAFEREIGPPPEVVSLAPPRVATASLASPLLRFDNVHFAYTDSLVEQTRGASFDIAAGDVIALMGPNGAGKSTLCRLAIGLLRPQAGTITLSGRDSATMSTAEIVRSVGYAFQSPSATIFANTLREELSFGPRNLGIPAADIEHRIQSALQIVNLPGLDLNGSPFALSFGQQKRISLAGVLAMQPRVLLMDEPTAGLDEATAEHLMRSLFQAPGRPEALVFVTHDLRLARRYANRVLLYHAGQIVADGAPGDVLNDADAMRRGGLA